MSPKQDLPSKAEEFIASLVGRSQATKRLYRIILRDFFDHVQKDIDILEAKDFHLFFQIFEKKYGYKKNSIRVYVTTLRSFLRFLGRDDIRKQIRSVKPPKTLPSVPKPEEIEKMIKAAGTLRDKLAIKLLSRTGLRVGELCNSHIQDIDLQNQRLMVRDHGQWIPKGAKARGVKFDAETAKLIKKHIGLRKDGLLLDVKPSTIRAMVKKVARNAGLINPERITPHCIRHFFACDFLRRGGDIRSLQKLLGHETLSVTQVYLDYSFDMVADVYDRICGGKSHNPINDPKK